AVAVRVRLTGVRRVQAVVDGVADAVVIGVVRVWHVADAALARSVRLAADAGTERAVGLLHVRGALLARARARLVDVADAVRGAAGEARRLEGIRRTVVPHAVAALGQVAAAGRRATHTGALPIRGARCGRTVAEFGDVAIARRRATQRAGTTDAV